jgi:hypothetical protein
MQDKLDSPSHDTHSQDESARHEEESQASMQKYHHGHHHDTSASQSKMSTTLTAATSMTPAVINHNVNVQFDPSTPQATKPNRLSLIVTEQKVGEPIKDLISYMTNLCI